MMLDSELEALIRDSVARELPRTLRENLARLIPPPPQGTPSQPHPLKTVVVLILLSLIATGLWAMAHGSHPANPPSKGPVDPNWHANGSKKSCHRPI